MELFVNLKRREGLEEDKKILERDHHQSLLDDGEVKNMRMQGKLRFMD